MAGIPAKVKTGSPTVKRGAGKKVSTLKKVKDAAAAVGQSVLGAGKTAVNKTGAFIAKHPVATGTAAATGAGLALTGAGIGFAASRNAGRKQAEQIANQQ